MLLDKVNVCQLPSATKILNHSIQPMAVCFITSKRMDLVGDFWRERQAPKIVGQVSCCGVICVGKSKITTVSGFVAVWLLV